MEVSLGIAAGLGWGIAAGLAVALAVALSVLRAPAADPPPANQQPVHLETEYPFGRRNAA